MCHVFHDDDLFYEKNVVLGVDANAYEKNALGLYVLLEKIVLPRYVASFGLVTSAMCVAVERIVHPTGVILGLVTFVCMACARTKRGVAGRTRFSPAFCKGMGVASSFTYCSTFTSGTSYSSTRPFLLGQPGQ